MITKNAGKLSKAYFKSYMQLVMSARAFSLDEAKSFAFDELFQSDEMKNGKETYQKFTQAYTELLEEEKTRDES
ncbi:hypothetical protein [Pseudalkalibacillus hwajinpoensis]|uniref:hypothetical protein n=1 Tax=Guptibacillus hwajinpoensis TaxID=208199 RepID=UPI001CFCF8AB|nr:hypothetical protein [Pseudalkalibacillus hwajinpoensis]